MKRTLFILTALFGLLLSSSPALAYDCEVDGIYYNLNKTDKTASVTKGIYSGIYSGNIIIPETITYNNTTYSVTSIGDRAFDQCSGLTSVTIPNSVTTIGEEVFGNCSRLNSVIVDKNNGTYDSRDNCNAIIKTSTNKLIVGCKNTTIPNSVTSIGDRAFYGCSELTSVTIPNSVTSIGESAFYGCSGLTSAIIGNSVKSIGESAFDSCSGLTSVTIGNSVKSIGEGAFRYCSGLTSVTIPNSVTFIGEDAFSDCSGLTSVTIGNSVTSIGQEAFCGCSGLTSVTIPNAVISIGYGAFSDCSGLTSVTIGNSVTSIGEIAFYGCSGLTKLVSLAIEPPVCGYQVFEGVDKTACRLLVPEESINKYKTADKWEEFLYISYNGVDDVSVDTQDAVYEVYNLQGVRVGSGMREAEITADALPHGIYILVSPQGRKKLKI